MLIVNPEGYWWLECTGHVDWATDAKPLDELGAVPFWEVQKEAIKHVGTVHVKGYDSVSPHKDVGSEG